jgi:DNA primase large subunit
MARIKVGEDYFRRRQAEMVEFSERYERAEIDDDTWWEAKSAFAKLEETYHEERQPLEAKYPKANTEQLLFDELCECVGISQQRWGPYAQPEYELELAQAKMWEIINALTETWDKGCIYYPHPQHPRLRQALVDDLRDSNRRNRARKRNRSDMEKGSDYRGATSLMANPPSRPKIT